MTPRVVIAFVVLMGALNPGEANAGMKGTKKAAAV